MRLVGNYKDGKPLAAMLLAGYPKTDDERLLLAAYHRGEFKKRPGRPADDDAIRAAELYPKAKRELAKFEKETGRRIRKRGDAAITLTLAYLSEQGHAVPELEKLKNLLRRSKKPRTKKPRIKR